MTTQEVTAGIVRNLCIMEMRQTDAYKSEATITIEFACVVVDRVYARFEMGPPSREYQRAMAADILWYLKSEDDI